jgi:molecular chaperone HtpG
VGMTKSELQNSLGRIAQSGTKTFLEAPGDGGPSDVNLIRQFGLGFYSAYLVADKAEVVTKSMQPCAAQFNWTLDASNLYTIVEGRGAPMEGSRTRLVLYLKDDALEYLEAAKLEDLLQHYSNFVEVSGRARRTATLSLGALRSVPSSSATLR